jgi:hypothetical protein
MHTLLRSLTDDNTLTIRHVPGAWRVTVEQERKDDRDEKVSAEDPDLIVALDKAHDLASKAKLLGPAR